MERTKAWRRHQDNRVIQKRLHELKEWTHDSVQNVEFIHVLSKTHFGCGCSQCKPWKHGMDEKYKPSERSHLQDD